MLYNANIVEKVIVMSTPLIIADINVLIFELGIIIFFSVFVSFILKKFGIPAVLGFPAETSYVENLGQQVRK